MSDRFKQALAIEPDHPFESGQFDGLDSFPGRPAMDQFRLVKTVDGFGQRIVVAVALAADGRFDSGFGETLGIADRNILCKRPVNSSMN